MGDDTYGSFHCPAQECQQHQSGSDFRDAKRFHLHWFSTHKPRCPRTDCKYSLSNLSKSTESYFLRHWSTHFPELSTGKSACGQCGRQFANANNRARHAAKCEGSTAAADQSTTEVPSHELESELDVGSTQLGEWSEIVTHQDPIKPSSCDSRLFSPENHVASSVELGEPSFETDVAVPISSLQLTAPMTNSDHAYEMIEQMLASPGAQYSLPDLAHDPLPSEGTLSTIVLHNGSLANLGSEICSPWSMAMPDGMPSSSRKRAAEDTIIPTSKRHQCIANNVDSSVASLTHNQIQASITVPAEDLVAVRQQQKKETAQAEIAQHRPALKRKPTKTISPKYALLDYNETDQQPLFQDTIPTGYKQHFGGTEQFPQNFFSQGNAAFATGLNPSQQNMTSFRATNSADGFSGGNFNISPSMQGQVQPHIGKRCGLRN